MIDGDAVKAAATVFAAAPIARKVFDAWLLGGCPRRPATRCRARHGGGGRDDV